MSQYIHPAQRAVDDAYRRTRGPVALLDESYSAPAEGAGRGPRARPFYVFSSVLVRVAMARSSAAARRASACWGVSTTGLLFVVRGNISGRSPRTPPLWPGAMTRPGFFLWCPHRATRFCRFTSRGSFIPDTGAPTSSREEPARGGSSGPGAVSSPSSGCGGLSGRPGTMVSARAATARLEKTFARFQGFAVRADLRGSDNRRDRLSLSRLLEM